MFTEAFWSAVLSNLIPDFLIGVVIVGAISLINAQQEKREIDFEERKGDEIKALIYLKSFYHEVGMNSCLSRKFLEKNDFSREVTLSTSYWDAIIQTGEAPKVLIPTTYVHLSGYYNTIQRTIKINSLIFEARLFNNSSMEENLKKELVTNLKKIQKVVDDNGLIAYIIGEINITEEKISKINTEIRKTNLIYIINDFFKEKISEDVNQQSPRFKEG